MSCRVIFFSFFLLHFDYHKRFVASKKKKQNKIQNHWRYLLISNVLLFRFWIFYFIFSHFIIIILVLLFRWFPVGWRWLWFEKQWPIQNCTIDWCKNIYGSIGRKRAGLRKIKRVFHCLFIIVFESNFNCCM